MSIFKKLFGGADEEGEGHAVPGETADSIILGELSYEFDFTNPTEVEQKIKKRLRYYKCGPYDQERVDLLRSLKNELQAEVLKHEKSKYYIQSTGEYAAMEDFDIHRITEDACRQFTEVPRSEIESFVQQAIFVYYLR
jgi:hypothetical protein